MKRSSAPKRGPLAPKKSLGQHFLFDPNILSRIVDLSGLTAEEAGMEIGPGPGGLTRALADTGASIVALETDPRMVEHLATLGLDNVEVIHGDAMEADFTALSEEKGGPFRLVANLPYNLSGPLLARLLEQRVAFRSMTLMFQREVADRIAAPPGNKVRGGLSVISQAFCTVKMGFRVPPGAFRPPPKVDSMVIHLEVLDEPIAPITDEKFFWQLVRGGFQQRRKMLRNALKRFVEEPDAVMEGAGLKGTERPEDLSVEEWITLANQAASQGGK